MDGVRRWPGIATQKPTVLRRWGSGSKKDLHINEDISGFERFTSSKLLWGLEEIGVRTGRIPPPLQIQFLVVRFDGGEKYVRVKIHSA